MFAPKKEANSVDISDQRKRVRGPFSCLPVLYYFVIHLIRNGKSCNCSTFASYLSAAHILTNCSSVRTSAMKPQVMLQMKVKSDLQKGWTQALWTSDLLGRGASPPGGGFSLLDSARHRHEVRLVVVCKLKQSYTSELCGVPQGTSLGPGLSRP